MTLLCVFLLSLAAMLVVMASAWAFQRAVKMSAWVDVFWTYGTGAVGAAAALAPFNDVGPRQILAAALIALWSLRLGTHVARRIGVSGEDARYSYFKSEWGAGYQRTLLIFVLPQALVTALLCLSIHAAAAGAAPFGLRDMLAGAVLLIAIAGEGLADRQLAAFKAAGPPKGAICQDGLWGWSRHPNYFFEWFGWLAWLVMGLDFAQPISLVTLIAPAVMFAVLRFGTGVPPLERTMLASRGEAFARYQARTSAFIPLPPKSGA